ncbi:hypothetical protein [Hydrogenophaga sp.]|uniref:hypothetical protein n=1 Tax=Hydrogenophaga sp. TaxID=1904254 RepID=UPI002636F1CD|nr:hypothetical protein [Hydrogenophaga sp.]MCW5654911.1 hypothetical protein [Hydrogenophaga sp.]
MCALFCCLVGWVPAVGASPTANEFEPCHRAAAAHLQRCLSDDGTGAGQACWPQVRRRYEACRDAVVRSHQPPDAARLKALREASRPGSGR